MAETVFVPLTVGGGVRKIEDIRNLLNAGRIKWRLIPWQFLTLNLLLNLRNALALNKGYDLDLMQAITSRVNVPVIASGGVGNLQHLADGVLKGGADAVLAASIFHFGEYSIAE